MQTTTQGFKYVEPADAIADYPTPDQSNWKLVEARTPRRVTPAQFAALTGLVDGQEIELELDEPRGIYWRFRYRAGSASAYKWEFVGGPPLIKDAAGAVLSTMADVTGWKTIVATYFALPRPGEFEVGGEVRVTAPPAGSRVVLATVIKSVGAPLGPSGRQSAGAPAATGPTTLTIPRQTIAGTNGDSFGIGITDTNYDSTCVWLATHVLPIRISQ
jgi:hypothetical protein